MKKLLLIAAILAIGTTVFAGVVSDGYTDNGTDTMFSPQNGLLNVRGADYDGYKEITLGDKTIHNDGGVNIFRDKGRGWRDTAKTEVRIKVIQKVKIESESDYLYAEAVKGDGLEFGDIGFKVKGGRDVEVTFKFKGELFKKFNGKATAKRLGAGNGGIRTANLGTGSVQEVTLPILNINSPDSVKNLEVDLYFYKLNKIGTFDGTIKAIAIYK